MRRFLLVVALLTVLPAAAFAQPPGQASAEQGALAEQSRLRGRRWTWVAAGAASALALGGLVVGLNAKTSYDELEARCAPGCARADADAVGRRAVTADVLLGAAATAAGAALVLYFVEGRAPAASPAKGSSTSQIAPLAGPGSFGIQASLKY